MYKNVVFSGIGTYHPPKQVDNSHFIEHFHKANIEVNGLMNHLGRKTRHFADAENENTVTMAFEAAKKAILNAHISAEDINLIIFATDTPEHICPTNAMLLNDRLNAKNAHMVFDINSNCIGMLTAVDVASRIIQNNPEINKGLVVGSFFGSLVSSKADPVCYSNMADAAAALVLERKEENRRRGFIDSNFKTDPVVKDKFLFPVCGFSKMYDDHIDMEDKKLKMDPFDTSFISREWCDLITGMLDKNNVDKNSVKQYFFSQFSKPDAESTLDMLGLSRDSHTFIGDKYGYTGVTSPFIAYNAALDEKKVDENDNVVFCSVGAGYNICSMLYRL